jgi:hypothetical protein
MSGARLASRSAERASTPARSSAVMAGQAPSSKAARAAATARSTSASVAPGAWPTTSSVDGDTTGKVPPPAGATQRPPR